MVIGILRTYEQVAVQAVNFDKFGVFFSNNIAPELQVGISYILEVNSPLNTGRYLGLPSLLSRGKKVIFAYLRDRIWNRLQS